MKKFLCILLAVLMVGSFAACNSNPSDDGSDNGGGAVDYPKGTITAICPWAAGGGTDTFLRAICSAAEPILGQTVTVSNVTGGGGATGHGSIISSPNDGYTIGMITFELNSLPPQGLVTFTYKDLDPLLRLNMDASALTVPVDAPYNTLEEFIDYAKEHPGEVTVGNSGTGGVWHLAAGLMEQTCDISLKHVPYDGAAPAVTDLAGKHIDAVSVSAAEVQAQVKAGTLKILAIMSDERDPNWPDVPTFKECGYDISFGTWRGLAVPKGTPDEVKQVLVDAFTKAYEDESFQKLANELGLGLAYMDTDEFNAFLASNAETVAETMKSIGLVE